MRPRLPFSLKAALLASCVFCPFATSASVSDGSLGNVMYVGDSITHGVNSGSYRWALHKIFADNGISYSTAGINTGNYSGGVAAGISYGGRVFNNAHSSQASARAYEIAGRARRRQLRTLQRFQHQQLAGPEHGKNKRRHLHRTNVHRNRRPRHLLHPGRYQRPSLRRATTARSTTASPPSRKTCLETWIPWWKP